MKSEASATSHSAVANPMLDKARADLDELDRFWEAITELSKSSLPEDQERTKVLTLKYMAMAERLKIETQLIGLSETRWQMVHAFFEKPSRFSKFGLSGANRSGKSRCAGWCMFAKFLRDCAKPGAIFWIISPSEKKSIEGQQKECYEALPKSMFGDVVYNPETGFGGRSGTIILEPNGRKIVLRWKTASQYDSDPASFETEKVTGIWIDETVQHGLFKRCLPRIVDTNGWIIVSTIPDDPWIDDEFGVGDDESLVNYVMERPMEYTISIRMSTYDNKNNLGEEGIKRFAASLTEDEKEMRLWGRSLHKTGVVFHEFKKLYKPDGHLIKPFKIPREWPRYRGMDVGLDRPTVLLWCVVSPNENLYVYREYVARKTTIEADVERILAMSEGEIYLSPVLIDPSAYNVTKANPVSVGMQYANAGLRCRAAQRASASEYGEYGMIQRMKRRLENNSLFVFDTCPYLIYEFKNWRLKRNKENQPMDRPNYEAKGNDACLVGDTLVKTPDGPKPISAFAGRWQKVLTPFGVRDCFGLRTAASVDVWTLELDNGKKITGTENHLLLTMLSFDTIEHIQPGDVLYGPRSDFQNDPSVRREEVLLRQSPLLHAGGEAAIHVAFASEGLGEEQRPNSSQTCHSPHQSQFPRQSDFQSGVDDGFGTHTTSRSRLDAQAQARSGQVGRKNPAHDQGVASEQGWAGMAQATRQNQLQANAARLLMLRLREEMLDARPAAIAGAILRGDVPGKSATVKSKRYSGVAEVFDLYVPTVHCFNLTAGCVAHNCDALKYVIAANPKWEIPVVEIETVQF